MLESNNTHNSKHRARATSYHKQTIQRKCPEFPCGGGSTGISHWASTRPFGVIVRNVMARHHEHTPPPSVGHEVGVIFGFIGTCCLPNSEGKACEQPCTSVVLTFFWSLLHISFDTLFASTLTDTAFIIICCLVYGIAWQRANKRSQLKEAARIERLRASGLLRSEKERE